MLKNAPSLSEIVTLARSKLNGLIEKFEEGKDERGFIGVIDFAQAKWVLPATTRRGYVYVTLQRTSATAPVEALCSTVTPQPGTPVIVRRTKTGFIILPDHEQMNQFSPGVNLAVGRHTHQLGFGNEDFVEALRFEPLLAHIVSGGNSLFITVNEGFYRYNNLNVWFPSGNIDLTSYRPAVAATWCWVMVGIDMTANTLIAEAGSAVPIATPLDPDTLDDIDLGVDALPIAGIKLKNAQSAIADYRVFYDARPFASGMNAPSSGGSGGDEGIYLALAGL